MLRYLTLGVGCKHVILLPPTEEADKLAMHRFGARDPLAALPTTACEPRARSFPPRPLPELVDAVLRLGGFWFDLHAEAETNSAVTLFIPAGWWHWLAGVEDCDWHVAWGGSFLPIERP